MMLLVCISYFVCLSPDDGLEEAMVMDDFADFPEGVLNFDDCDDEGESNLFVFPSSAGSASKQDFRFCVGVSAVAYNKGAAEGF